MPKRQTAAKKQAAPQPPPAKRGPIPIEQLLIAAARENYNTYGTRIPLPPEVLKVMIATCPHCEESGTIEEKFGIRTSKYTTKKGTVERFKPHSWCKQCRGSKDAHPSRYGAPLKRRSV